MPDTDYYAILGVPRNADSAEISRAFRRLAQTCHPDQFPNDPIKNAEYLRYSGAYMVLDNAGQKALYDEFGEAGLRPGFDPEVARAAMRAAEGGRRAGGSVRGGERTGNTGWFGGNGFGDFFNDIFENLREGMGEVEQEILKKRAREAQAGSGNGGGGEGDRGGGRPRSSGPRVKPHIKFGLKDLKIPFYEFNLIAGLMKAERTEGPVQIEQGNYRIIKDEHGAVRVDVKLTRFQQDGSEIRIRPPKGFESKVMKKYDWVDSSWITPLTVEGIRYPMSYRDLILKANEVALKAVHDGELDNHLIESLNSCARISFPDDLKKIVKGEEAVELLTKEGERWTHFEERRRGDGREGRHRRDEARPPQRDGVRSSSTESKPVGSIPKPESPPRDLGNTSFTSFVGGGRKR